tara:strand:+ start:217 stop:759 length:543 start_codon:yes stop_codon:yes gene_type:complete
MKPLSSQFAYETHQLMDVKSVRLTFSGEFSPNLISVLLLMAKKTLGRTSIMKKTYNIMIECLENLTKHALMNEGDTFPAIFVLGKDDDFYYLATGNKIAQEKISNLKDRLEKANSLDRVALLNWYNDILIRDQELNQNGGAGLGIIDMALKSKHKFEYAFQEIDAHHSFFTLKVKINSAD